MDWIAIIRGFGIGAVVGMTGVGGGSLMTPLLIGAFRLLGIWVGARLTRSLPERAVRMLPCSALVTAGIKVIA